MEKGDPNITKTRFLEAFGCLLYVIAFLVMGAVLVSKCGVIFR